MAKFGIALEWGSRGLEFESQHSDQNNGNRLAVAVIFLLLQNIERGADGGCSFRQKVLYFAFRYLLFSAGVLQ